MSVVLRTVRGADFGWDDYAAGKLFTEIISTSGIGELEHVTDQVRTAAAPNERHEVIGFVDGDWEIVVPDNVGTAARIKTLSDLMRAGTKTTFRVRYKTGPGASDFLTYTCTGTVRVMGRGTVSDTSGARATIIVKPDGAVNDAQTLP